MWQNIGYETECIVSKYQPKLIDFGIDIVINIEMAQLQFRFRYWFRNTASTLLISILVLK